jgi:hypothetical protein
VELNRMALPIALIFVALLVALVLLVTVQPATEAEGKSESTANPPSAAPAARPRSPAPDQFAARSGEVLLSPVAPSSEVDGADETSATQEASWEAPINAILEAPEDNDQVVLRLAALVPTLPPDGQVEAAQHMVNLLDDENYQTALQMLLNPGMPTEVQEVIYSDILNRPNTVKLPALTALIGAPNHGLRDEALNTLQIFVGHDLGNNPLAWKSAVDEFLRQESLQDQVEAAPQ